MYIPCVRSVYPPPAKNHRVSHQKKTIFPTSFLHNNFYLRTSNENVYPVVINKPNMPGILNQYFLVLRRPLHYSTNTPISFTMFYELLFAKTSSSSYNKTRFTFVNKNNHIAAPPWILNHSHLVTFGVLLFSSHILELCQYFYCWYIF